MKVELNDNITLYNADCIDILKSIPDDSIDLIVTDPPYLIPQINGGGVLIILLCDLINDYNA